MIGRLRRLIGGRRPDLRATLADVRAERDRLRGKLEAAEALARAGGYERLDAFAAEEQWQAEAIAAAAKRAAGEPLTILETEIGAERAMPAFLASPVPLGTPPSDIAFVTVCNDRFVPGLEAFLRSLRAVYPVFEVDIHVFHDGTLTDFVRRRLTRIHARLIFSEPDMGWLGPLPDASGNHRRIGALGYMNVMALGLTGYSRIILVDADMLVLGGLAPLWTGAGYAVAPDCGARPFAVRSPATGDLVINSGVISLPGDAATPAALAEIQALANATAALPVCDMLDRFADQKLWNLYLRGRPKTWLPLNLNCNVKYLARWLGGDDEAVSILHFTGPKPWENARHLPVALLPAEPRPSPHPHLWTRVQRRQAMAARLADFADAPQRRQPRRAAAAGCILLASGQEYVGAELETIALAGSGHAADHLLLAPDLLGGWNTQAPTMPQNVLDSRADAVLWLPHYFRAEAGVAALAARFELSWLLIEDPFRRFVDAVGRYDPDPAGFLDDARSDLLTMGVPAALAMGFRRIVLPPPPEEPRARFAQDCVAAALHRMGIATA